MNKLNARANPDTKVDYLLEFPGFQNAFSTPLEIAVPGKSGFIECPEPPASLDLKGARTFIRDAVFASVKQAMRAAPGSVVVTRRLAQNARQLFYSSMLRFPQRVVLHKRTPFSNDERLGFREGFDGVRDVEMLSVIEDPQLRFIASKVRDTKIEVDKYFPVPRGAAVVLSDQDALLLLHGAAPSIRSGYKYFKGRKGVPVPQRIHRYAGKSDLATVVDEILGLSKMSWNSFDLYANVPATIESSNEIARIGRLLDRFGPLSYDYRLFI